MSSPKMFRKGEVDGKVVVEASGKTLGKAKDIAFGLDGTVALIVVGDDNKEIQITMDRVAGVDDYIVVRPEVKGDQAPKRQQPAVGSAASAPMPAPAQPPPIANPGIPQAPVSSPAPPMAAAATCRSCGAPLRAGAKFCTKCGTPV